MITDQEKIPEIKINKTEEIYISIGGGVATIIKVDDKIREIRIRFGLDNEIIIFVSQLADLRRLLGEVSKEISFKEY